MKLLCEIQRTLNAPKNQFNKFGGFNYRNCEDILQAVKPLLKDSIIIVSDELELIGDRYYVKAIATYRHESETISAVAYAREADHKKGMDDAMVTGSASSYARKYALNGLLLIDDNKDPDYNHGITTNDNSKPKKAPKRSELATVMTDMVHGSLSDLDVCEYWRSLDQKEQEQQWKTIDKDMQKQLKAMLAGIK